MLVTYPPLEEDLDLGNSSSLLICAWLAALTLVSNFTWGAAAMPQRVVSLNLCSDELLLMLADPQQVRSVTWLVKDPTLSWLADTAAAVPSNRGLAEEIVSIQPDLVLAGTFTTPATVALLNRLQVPILQLSMPSNVEEVQAQILQVSRALGHAARGRQVVADMQARLKAMPPLPDGRKAPTAALYQPNGLTATEGSLVHDVLVRAGLVNLAASRSLPNYTRLSMEVLILDQPDVLVMNNYEEKMPSLAQELLKHPVLRKAFAETATVIVPAQAWSCGTPNIVRAIELLRDAAVRVARSA